MFTSFHKKKADMPWHISFFLGEGHVSSTIGKDGNIATGKRLYTELQKIEKDIVRYPFEVSFTHIADNAERSVNAVLMGDNITYMELTPVSARTFHKGKKIQGEIVYKENPFSISLHNHVLFENPEEEMSVQATEESLTSLNDEWVIIGEPLITDHTDGDTIEIKAEVVGKALSKRGIKVGDQVRIRYLGADTPETRKTSGTASQIADADKRNNAYAQYFQVTLDDAYSIADEAKQFSLSYLKKGKLLVHLDRTQTGQLIDTYGRYVAAVYPTPYKTSQEVVNAMKDGGNVFPNLSKLLLTTYSKKKAKAPLAYMAYNYVINDYKHSMLNPTGWIAELGLKVFDPGSKDNPSGMVTPDLGNRDSVITSPFIDEKIEDGKSSLETNYSDDFISNLTDFVPPNDDRFDEIYKYKDDEAIFKDSRVRIGDVLLTIPPLAIRTNISSNIVKVKPLRTKSSIMTKAGSSMTAIEMDLYFHDLVNINGIPRKTGDLTFYVDGLRSLIAQFTKCPFVPIDNPYINRILGIHNVALIDLQVQTVPGFPHSISATITLAKFESEGYMPHVAFLGETINYPLMRWYYQQSMTNRGPNRIFLKPIEGELTNDFTFTIAKKDILETRQNAIKELNTMETPAQLKDKVKKGQNELGRMQNDARTAEKVLAQISKYKEIQGELKAYDAIEDGSVLKYVSDNYQKVMKLDKEDMENVIAKAKKSHSHIYGKSKVGKATSVFVPYESPAFYPTRGVQTNAPSGSGPIGSTQTITIDWPAVPSQYEKNKDFKGFEKSGFVHIGLQTGQAIGLFPESYKSGKEVDGATGFYVPLTGDNFNKLNKIAKLQTDVDVTIEEYEDNYNGLIAIVDATENDIPMEDYHIPGLLPTNVSVSYTNEFSSQQILESGSPALQYLGGQDPYLTVSFEATEEAVEKIKDLLETADTYARSYRMGITSGYLGIKNQLAELFGVTTVMVEHASIQTVPNFPGRNQIQLTMVGFNKTQRRQESLNGFAAAGKDDTLEDRKGTVSDRQMKDDAIVEIRLRKMEVYPDLELPTYTELQKGIEQMKLEGDIPDFPNRTGATYVDPDFYVGTTWTLRDLMNKEYTGEHKMNMQDTSGVKMTSSSDSDKIMDGSKDMTAILDELKQKTPRVDSKFSWGSNSKTEGKDYNGDGKNEAVTYKDAAIGEYLTKKGENGKFEYQNPPSFEDYKNWKIGTKEDEYKAWIGNPNPSEFDVYKYTLERMRAHFKGDIKLSGQDMLSKKDKSTDAENRVCYSASESLYAVEYTIIKSNLSGGNQKEVDKRIASGGFKEPKIDNKKCSMSDYSHFKYKIPEERVFGLVKALFQYASRWQQASGKYPKLDSAKNACGVAGVPIADVANNVDEAKRLLWDWKYNIDKGVEYLAKVYGEAARMDRTKFTELCSRPWDCMLFAYKTGKQPANAKELEEHAFVGAIHDIFYRSYAKDYAYGTPSVHAHSDIYNYRKGVNKNQAQANKKELDKATMIKYLVDEMGYKIGHAKYKEIPEYNKLGPLDKIGAGIAIFDDDDKYWAKEWLKLQSEKKVREIFEQQIKNLKREADWKKKHPILSKLEDFFAVGSDSSWSDALVGGMREELSTEEGKNTADIKTQFDNLVEAVQKNPLLGNDDPKQLYREMYTDLRMHDQRGRLLRAFPAFQMLIIDEGHWMSNYRFWDNMYGFNAIESIDVYRSRKIAADTAVIRMTNMYSNLTSRRADIDYIDHEYSLVSNLIFEKPTEELLEARKEILKSMMLQTGARVHLRMGYGSDAAQLPIVFNGTITEMDTQEVIEITCQGDGVELGNIISGDPDDDNNGFFHVTEPRDLICKLLSSKGSWFKDVANNISKGVFMRENPLGIQHFGIPGEMAPAGTLQFFNPDYGECAQNVYSSNGTPTFSEWTHADGTSRNIFDWQELMNTNITRWFQPGDEDNIIVKFYNNTPWDVFQTLAYCSLDYIAAVHPFETRSTLFFGKPYWKMAYGYNSKYKWDENKKAWLRNLTSENRKPYMQARFYDSNLDIIQNRIKASEQGVFTNAIVNYDGNQTPILSADFDIRYDKQKTQVIEAEIVARFPGVPGGDYNTSEYQARNYGMSAVRDSLKDMYKGSLLVMGDPSVKPHDIMYFNDNVQMMNGTCLVKAVTHHFSHETGFVTSIEPDAYVVNDDKVMISFNHWVGSAMSGVASTIIGFGTARWAKRKITTSPVLNRLAQATKEMFPKLGDLAVRGMLSLISSSNVAEVKDYKDAFEKYFRLPKDHPGREAALKDFEKAGEKLEKVLDEAKDAYKKGNAWKIFGRDKVSQKHYHELKAAVKNSKRITKALRAGQSGVAVTEALVAGRGALALTGVGLAVQLVSTVLAESLFEAMARFKEALQCVWMVPLQYKGREFTAGINGHKGMVVGDSPGKLDKLMMASFGDGKDDGVAGIVMSFANFFSPREKEFSLDADEKEIEKAVKG